jgi:hypothetical protein
MLRVLARMPNKSFYAFMCRRATIQLYRSGGSHTIKADLEKMCEDPSFFPNLRKSLQQFQDTASYHEKMTLEHGILELDAIFTQYANVPKPDLSSLSGNAFELYDFVCYYLQMFSDHANVATLGDSIIYNEQ